MFDNNKKNGNRISDHFHHYWKWSWSNQLPNKESNHKNKSINDQIDFLSCLNEKEFFPFFIEGLLNDDDDDDNNEYCATLIWKHLINKKKLRFGNFETRIPNMKEIFFSPFWFSFDSSSNILKKISVAFVITISTKKNLCSTCVSMWVELNFQTNLHFASVILIHTYLAYNFFQTFFLIGWFITLVFFWMMMMMVGEKSLLPESMIICEIKLIILDIAFQYRMK